MTGRRGTTGKGSDRGETGLSGAIIPVPRAGPVVEQQADPVADLDADDARADLDDLAEVLVTDDLAGLKGWATACAASGRRE